MSHRPSVGDSQEPEPPPSQRPTIIFQWRSCARMLEGGAVAACQTGQWAVGSGPWEGMRRSRLSRKDSDNASARSIRVYSCLPLRVGLDRDGRQENCSTYTALCNNLTTEGGCRQRSAESTVLTPCLTTVPTHEGASRDLAEARKPRSRPPSVAFAIHCQRPFESLIDFILSGKPSYGLGFNVKAANLGI